MTVNAPVLLTLTSVDASCPLPPVAVAVTVQVPVVAGAVNKPLLLIVPQEAVHVTAALAEKAIVPLGATVGVKGDIVRVVEPVPERDTVCGLLPAPSVNTSVAARDPATVGLNTTEAVQLAEAARLAPQVFAEIENSPGFAPDKPTLLIAMAAVLLFVKVAVIAALLEFSV